MAGYMREKLEGAAELERALMKLGAAVATDLGDEANRKAAELAQDEFYQAAPYDPHRDPNRPYGHLRVNIDVVKQVARKTGRIIHFVGIGHAFWGRMQELGTAKMRARPWMRPAFDRIVRALIGEQADTLRSGIERIARDAPKGKRP